MTLVDASHTPDQSSADSRVSEAGSAKIPLKLVDAQRPKPIPWRARLSLLWQRIVLTARWCFRLPIDDVRDQAIENALKGLMTNDRNLLAQLNKLISVSNQMQRRLLFYEKHVPRIRDLKRDFDRIEAGIVQAADAPVREPDLSNGILKPATNGNGEKHIIELREAFRDRFKVE